MLIQGTPQQRQTREKSRWKPRKWTRCWTGFFAGTTDSDVQKSLGRGTERKPGPGRRCPHSQRIGRTERTGRYRRTMAETPQIKHETETQRFN